MEAGGLSHTRVFLTTLIFLVSAVDCRCCSQDVRSGSCLTVTPQFQPGVFGRSVLEMASHRGTPRLVCTARGGDKQFVEARLFCGEATQDYYHIIPLAGGLLVSDCFRTLTPR